MVGGLTTGRLLIAQAAIDSLKIGVSIAIRYALQRMEEGEYGACESCGEPITYRRLLVRPVATQCIDCKTQAEQLERRSRAI